MNAAYVAQSEGWKRSAHSSTSSENSAFVAAAATAESEQKAASAKDREQSVKPREPGGCFLTALTRSAIRTSLQDGEPARREQHGPVGIIGCQPEFRTNS